jgi:aldehyde dehydrogenase (NAD+)
MARAEQWALASAFSNAGQRCAAASRILVFDAVYDEFVSRFVNAAGRLKLGTGAEDFLGPVMNERCMKAMLAAVQSARERGATVLTGGVRLTDAAHAEGFYVAPTILSGVSPDDEISQAELFGPITIVYRVRDLADAIALTNNSRFGLTASIHTASLHRAMRFAESVQTGVVVINGGTHGSEPHMGFGGQKNSGTGWREAGVEALDVYSDWKYVNIISDPALA